MRALKAAIFAAAFTFAFSGFALAGLGAHLIDQGRLSQAALIHPCTWIKYPYSRETSAEFRSIAFVRLGTISRAETR